MLMCKLCLILISFLISFVSAEGESLFKLFNLEQCPKFRIRKSTIIQSRRSVNDGAIYLGKKTASSARGCHDQCCQTDGCNLVTLKYNTQTSAARVTCFMFNCHSPSVCSFYQHKSYHSYAALEYEDNKFVQATKMAQGHKFKDEKAETTVPTTKVVTTTETTTTATTATTTAKPKFVKPKYNDRFTNTDHWGSQKTGLDDGVDTISTTHQADKSSNTKDISSWHKTAASENTRHENHESDNYGTYDHTQDMKGEVKAPSKAVDEEEDFPRRVFVDNNPDFPDEPHSHHKRPTPTMPPKTKGSPKMPKSTVTKSPVTKSPVTKPTVTKSPVSNIVIRKLNIQENKAVIPLAVGLVLALLLLMGVIFRLKTSRRRRTKAFLTDDADYLINGMYL